MRHWGQVLAALGSEGVHADCGMRGWRGIGRNLLIDFLLVAKRNLAALGLGNGDPPRQPLDAPQLRLGPEALAL